MLVLTAILMMAPFVTPAETCSPANAPEKCEAAIAKAHENSESLRRCLFNTGTQIAASDATIDQKYATFSGACSVERSLCVTTHTQAQFARFARAVPWDKDRWAIAMKNAANRCDETYANVAGRTVGPEQRFYAILPSPSAE